MAIGDLMDFSTEGQAESQTITPPWVLWNKKKSPKSDREEWFKNTYPILEKMSETRILTFANNLLWYTGEFEKTMEYRLVVPGQGERVLSRRTLPRIFNHLFDITEQRVSQMSRYKPDFDVLPTNKEEVDRAMSKLVKLCLQAISRRAQMDFIMQEVERWTAVFGECLISVDWNKNIGDKKSKKSLERVGDVELCLKSPWTYLPAPKRRYQDVDWAIDLQEILHVEEARSRYGSKIEPDGRAGVFTFDSEILPKSKDEVVVYRLIQLPSEFIPSGNISYFVDGKLVQEEEEYPYSHNEFPWERLTDIDVPGRLFPISFYHHLQPVQHVYNRLTSVMVRNALLVGHPHILNPRGSGVSREAFGNGPTEIAYNPVGGLKPEMVTFPSIPQEFFQLRSEVKQELGQIAGSQNALRGNPPSGTRAASMLRWFEEQQEQRLSTTILKHNEFIRRCFWKAASLVGDYYPKTGKERLIRVLGKENEYTIKPFISGDVKLSSEYDVVILNAAGFSNTMSGRLEEISLITQIEKDKQMQILTPQEVADVLEAKNPQKAYDILTSAQKSANIYNEKFLAGEPVPEPKPYWDLIVHWRTLRILMNSPQWEDVEQAKKDAAEIHLMMLEDLLSQQAVKSPAIAQQLTTMDFPTVFTPAPQPKPEEPATSPAAPPVDPAMMGAMPPMVDASGLPVPGNI